MEVSELNNNFEFNSFIYDRFQGINLDQVDLDIFHPSLNLKGINIRTHRGFFPNDLGISLVINEKWIISITESDAGFIYRKNSNTNEIEKRLIHQLWRSFKIVAKEAIRREEIRRNPAKAILEAING